MLTYSQYSQIPKCTKQSYPRMIIIMMKKKVQSQLEI